jgi:Putative beta barrel porin-7 (BBP7)
MKRKWIGSLSALLAGTSVALAQPPSMDPTGPMLPGPTIDSLAPAMPATAVQPAGLAWQPPGTMPGGAPGQTQGPPPGWNPSPYQPQGVPPAGLNASPYWPSPGAKDGWSGSDLPPPGAPAIDHSPSCGEWIWADAEYLLWWVKKANLSAPLVTAGDTTTFGTLGGAGTSVLYGGNGLDYDAFSGGRFAGGLWLTPNHVIGVEGGGFLLEDKPLSFLAGSDANGNPVLARPIFNATTGTETVELISAPGIVSGSVAVTSHSSLDGWDINLTTRCHYSNCSTLDLLVGYRNVHLGEDLNIYQSSTVLPGGVAGFAGSSIAAPGSFLVTDQFGTLNEFYGAQFGGRWEYRSDHWFVNALSKIALGDSHEVVTIAGTTATTPAGGTSSTLNGGLLALSSNSGRQTRDEFAVVPEIGINLGYAFTPEIRVFVGYTFLYWSDVVRPGDQVNRTINPALVPTSPTFGNGTGAALPGRGVSSTDFWAQGINLGLELRY